MRVTRLIVEFAIPVDVSVENERALVETVERICEENVPEGHRHWLARIGSMPFFSEADARLLSGMGHTIDPSIRPGEEPRLDDSIMHFSTFCRRKYEDE